MTVPLADDRVHCEDADDQQHYKVNCWACDHEGELYEDIPMITRHEFDDLPLWNAE